jgi:succinate dehydrogenase / fumarate reductase cytochrome b subunit
MALTGLVLIGFVIVHMCGNLLVYAGQDALNSYAAALKHRPGLLWVGRLFLLVVFVTHVVLGIRLTWENIAARPIRYVYEDTLHANWASRHMLLTGLVLLAFVLYHLAHFTFGVVKNANVQSTPAKLVDLRPSKDYLDLAEGRSSREQTFEPMPEVNLSDPPEHLLVRQDVYSMVVNGFRNRWITLSYLIAMAFLGLHLWHGGSSWFQSLGIEHPTYNRVIRGFGPVLAVVIVAGNCSIPLSIWLGIVK